MLGLKLNHVSKRGHWCIRDIYWITLANDPWTHLHQCCGITSTQWPTVYPKKYAHGFVVLCFVVVMQSFITNSHEVFIHIYQGCFAGTGAIVRLPQCQWSKPDGYGKISQCITTTKHSKAKTVCIFLGIYCTPRHQAIPFRGNTEILYYDAPASNLLISRNCLNQSAEKCQWCMLLFHVIVIIN